MQIISCIKYIKKNNQYFEMGDSFASMEDQRTWSSFVAKDNCTVAFTAARYCGWQGSMAMELANIGHFFRFELSRSRVKKNKNKNKNKNNAKQNKTKQNAKNLLRFARLAKIHLISSFPVNLQEH